MKFEKLYPVSLMVMFAAAVCVFVAVAALPAEPGLGAKTSAAVQPQPSSGASRYLASLSAADREVVEGFLSTHDLGRVARQVLGMHEAGSDGDARRLVRYYFDLPDDRLPAMLVGLIVSEAEK